MSILDDAIREHLELKRAHGADETELKRLEDEAFGPPGRPQEPDPFAEAPTAFMATPEAAEAGEGESARRRINIADLQEPPPEEPRAESEAPIESPERAAAPAVPAEDSEAARAVPAEDSDAAPAVPAERSDAAPPAEEEPPALEHEVLSEPGEPAPESEPEPAAEDAVNGPASEDRHAIAEQPTELFNVEAELGAEDAAAETPSPSDEEIVEAEVEEPKLVPVADEDEEDEEFWSEQRLSDELDQALEAPIADEEEDEDEEEAEHNEYDPDTGHEDVLEDTPDFLEDAPEDDELWFEQRPPKDFDFDD
jgi:hypothetical protein